jgi:formylglycine-generating enzyme required for sulfatase activity
MIIYTKTQRGEEMKTIWLLALILILAAFGVVTADEKAKKGDIPLYDGKPGEKIGDVRINPKDGAEMVWVPAGEFLMGTSDEEIAQLLKENPEWKAEWFNDEKPQRKVYLDGYWIYKYEVTVAQYRKFCEETTRKMPPAPEWGWNDDHPIVWVTWTDALDYAKWAKMALPTEAQWEKAARGTDGRQYPWGNKWDASKCNSNESGLERTTPVGSYPSGVSPYGCMDMAGNVGEWCADWYDEDYYRSAPLRNPTEPSVGSFKVVRGGGWNISDARRAASRSCADPYDNWFDDGGFRLCGSGE